VCLPALRFAFDFTLDLAADLRTPTGRRLPFAKAPALSRPSARFFANAPPVLVGRRFDFFAEAVFFRRAPRAVRFAGGSAGCERALASGSAGSTDSRPALK
jgi:hypothetical protein